MSVSRKHVSVFDLAANGVRGVSEEKRQLKSKTFIILGFGWQGSFFSTPIVVISLIVVMNI